MSHAPREKVVGEQRECSEWMRSELGNGRNSGERPEEKQVTGRRKDRF